MKFMISSASICLNSALKMPRTRAAAVRKCARRSSLTAEPTGVITILLPSRLNTISLPGITPVAMRMPLQIVTCPFSVTSMLTSNSQEFDVVILASERQTCYTDALKHPA